MRGKIRKLELGVKESVVGLRNIIKFGEIVVVFGKVCFVYESIDYRRGCEVDEDNVERRWWYGEMLACWVVGFDEIIDMVWYRMLLGGFGLSRDYGKVEMDVGYYLRSEIGFGCFYILGRNEGSDVRGRGW